MCYCLNLCDIIFFVRNICQGGFASVVSEKDCPLQKRKCTKLPCQVGFWPISLFFHAISLLLHNLATYMQISQHRFLSSLKHRLIPCHIIDHSSAAQNRIMPVQLPWGHLHKSLSLPESLWRHSTAPASRVGAFLNWPVASLCLCHRLPQAGRMAWPSVPWFTDTDPTSSTTLSSTRCRLLPLVILDAVVQSSKR